MKGILLILFVFWEKTPSLFIVFQTYNWCSESYRIGLAFRAVFFRFGFFSFVDFFRSRIFFCLRFFVFFIFFFESRDDDEVAYLVYVVRNDEVGWQQKQKYLVIAFLFFLSITIFLLWKTRRKKIIINIY
jgi:hypothetical protein